MSADAARPGGTAEALRAAFDRSFAEVRRSDAGSFETLLAIRIGGDAFALRVSELDGLFSRQKVVPIPGPAPELLGIAGLRGAIVPVYDLGALLGYPGAPECRWLALAAAGTAIGLAFAAFEGTVRLCAEDLVTDDGVQSRRRQVRELARTAHGVRPIIHVPSLIETIGTRIRHPT